MPLFSSLRAFVSSRLLSFFAKRAPRQSQITLNLRNVYIFFNKEGLLYAVLLVITFITGINYGNNLVLGLCFYLAGVWVIGFHLTFMHIFGLKLSLQHTPLTQSGLPAWVGIEMINDKSQPSRQIKLKFGTNANAVPSTHQQASLSNQSTALQDTDAVEQSAGMGHSLRIVSLQGSQMIELPIVTQRRGKMQLPRLIVSTVYPLGIMRAWAYVYFDSPVWVYPRPLAFEWQEAHVTSSAEHSEWSQYSAVGQNDFDSLDDYVAGESLARISWAHVARGQGMLTKQFADNVGHERRLDYSSMPAIDHEDKLAQLTYAVLQLSELGAVFQLNLPNDDGAIGQGDTFVQSCLLRLAKAP